MSEQGFGFWLCPFNLEQKGEIAKQASEDGDGDERPHPRPSLFPPPLSLLPSPPLSSHSKVRRRPLLRRPTLRHPHRRRRHRLPDPVLLGSLSRPGRRRRSGLSGAARPVLELDLTLPEKLQSGEGDRPRDERRGAEEERTADRERGAGPEQGPEATVRGERKTEEERGCC